MEHAIQEVNVVRKVEQQVEIVLRGKVLNVPHLLMTFEGLLKDKPKSSYQSLKIFV